MSYCIEFRIFQEELRLLFKLSLEIEIPRILQSFSNVHTIIEQVQTLVKTSFPL